jgi:PKD repeat protein
MGKLVRSLAIPSLALLFSVGSGARALGQEIIVNGGFHTDISSWTFDPGFGSAKWSSDQSLLLTNDAPPVNQTSSVSQCDSIQGGVFYDLSARVNPLNFIGFKVSSPGVRRVEHTGNLYVLLDFFPLDGCRGSGLAEFVRVDAGKNGWQTLGQTFLSPASAASVLTSLAIFKVQAESDLQGEFTDISITPSSMAPPPPVADFSFLPTSPSAGQAVQFGDASSGAPTGWSWNFGDPGSGGSNTATVQNPVHIFAFTGVYTVTLSATNAGGTGTRSRAVTVAPPPPLANFTFAPTFPLPGQAVQFTDASNGAPTGWSWNFGDPGSGASNTSTVQNPTHVFALAGVYTVTLSASNSGGSANRPHTVTVSATPPPVANFTFTPATALPGQDVQFTDTSSGAPTGWSWNFGDPGSGASNTSTVQNPTHVFALPGVYTVTLTASNAVGTGARTEDITVRCVRCPRVVPFR